MEQRFIWSLLIICSLFFLNACKKPLLEPETVDPVYQDLRSDQANAERGVEDKKKEIESLEVALEKRGEQMDVIERKHTRQQIFTAQKTAALMQQDVAYFKLRADTRKALDRDTYPAIFAADGKWPNLEEFERYKVAKRLKYSSRNWNDRVPRPAAGPTKEGAAGGEKKDAKPEAKAESGEKKAE